jgi:hypothetical protein
MLIFASPLWVELPTLFDIKVNGDADLGPG